MSRSASLNADDPHCTGLFCPPNVPLAQPTQMHRNLPKAVFSCPPSPTGLGSTFNHDHVGNIDAIGLGSTSAAHDIGLQSFRRMEALRLAANGDSMIAFDSENNVSRFRESGRIALDTMTPGGGTFAHSLRQNPSLIPTQLSSHNTLSNIGPSPARNATELMTLLGNSNARLKPRAKMVSSSGGHVLNQFQASDIVSLEQAKQRARVEVDVVLESATCVQGGHLRGQIKVRIRNRSKKEQPVLLAEGKLRVVGFETIPNEAHSHVFYQCAAPFSKITDTYQSLYVTSPDAEGYAQAVEGVHILPFTMELPSSSPFGSAKGILNLSSGVSVRYVVMISIRIKVTGSNKHSIAHFYRDCEIWPSLKLESILASAPRPLQASTAKGLSVLGGGSNDKVRLTANLHRLHWVAGQRCYVRVLVNNGSKKPIKHLALSLIRTVTIFKPKPALDAGHEVIVDPDACQTSTTHKLLAESVLEMSRQGVRGHASAKGWWTGVKPGQDLEFAHHVLLPSDALSITRGRLLEVEYSIRVTVSAGSLTSDIFVTLPIRIINFISIDPLPGAGLLSPSGAYSHRVKHSLRGKDSDLPASSRSSHVRQSALSSYIHGPSTTTSGARYGTSDNYQPQLSGFVPDETYLSPRLQVTNPDPPTQPDVEVDSDNNIPEDFQVPIALHIQQSLSEASIYSTDSSVSNMTSNNPRLGSLDFPFDADSDAELEQMMGSVKIQQIQPDAEDEDGSDFVKEVDENGSGDEGYSSSIISDNGEDSATSLEDVGRTHFTSRVREKLAARAQKMDHAIPVPIESETDLEEVTPRVQYTAPTDEHGATHDLPPPSTSASIGTTELVEPRSSLQRIPSSVRGPRSSRMLPRPPTSAIEIASTSDTHCMPINNSTTIIFQSRPSSDTLRLTGGSANSVKHRIAALEQRVKDVEGNDDTCM
ncbi:hypothetical protein QCA50_002151 [Cerrena zonata]|uniref:Arrestin C-terminal-like domain-containing protein n=1 Tax=Cerrena zonata TaxID=2478898 RepID=A0AAW0GMV2_9APHY